METLSIDWLATSSALTSTEHTIAVGDHLVSERDGYTHHGIYAGNGQVIHYGGFHRCAKRRPIEYIPLRGFAAGKGIKIQPEPHAIYTGIDAVDRARSRLGEDRYQLLTNNCEHFCTWCVLGVGRSEQVRQCLGNPWNGLKTLFALAKAQCMPCVTARSRLAGTVAISVALHADIAPDVHRAFYEGFFHPTI